MLARGRGSVLRSGTFRSLCTLQIVKCHLIDINMSSYVSPTQTSGMQTPPDCSVVGTKAFQSQPQVRIRMILTKSTHKAHKSIFYPGSGRPLANDPTSCFGGLSGVYLDFNGVISQGIRGPLSIAPTPPVPLPLSFSLNSGGRRCGSPSPLSRSCSLLCFHPQLSLRLGPVTFYLRLVTRCPLSATCDLFSS